MFHKINAKYLHQEPIPYSIDQGTILLLLFKIECTYSVRNLEKTIRFSLKFQPSERFHWPEMSKIKAEISLCTNKKLIFHKNVGWQGYQWIP